MNTGFNFDFIGRRKIFMIISASLIVLGLLVNIIFGVEMDVTFKGGTMLKYSYTDTLDAKELTSFFTEQIGATAEVEMSESGGVQVVNIYSTAVVDSEQQLSIDAAFAEKYPNNNVKAVSANSLSPTVGSLFFVKCLVATLIACLLLIVYVTFRFRKIGGFSAALMAVAALFHDLLMVYFAFVILRIPLNENFVAVMLTIIGYSLNDTIVIYDRIRENRLHAGMKADINEIVNTSLNQSFRRTLNTSITTLIVVIVMVVVALAQNLDSIISFAVPLLFGVISGFYSSTFLCAPLWAKWIEKRQAKGKK